MPPDVDWDDRRDLLASSMQRRARREKLFGDDPRACFLGELTIATILVAAVDALTNFVFRRSGWDSHTYTFYFLDAIVMSCVACSSISGMARVGTRMDARGFKAIVMGAVGGSLIASLMKLRPSLEVLALVMPALVARAANEHTDKLALQELEDIEQLSSERPKGRHPEQREALHIQARGAPHNGPSSPMG